MNQEQVMSVVRDVLQIVGTFLTTYGVINSGQWQPIAGGVLMMAPVIWGIYTHTQANAVAVVAAAPGTIVSADGKSITIVDRTLATAAKAAATGVDGK